MSNYNDDFYKQQQPARHRRSDRYRSAGQEGKEQQQPYPPQPQKEPQEEAQEIQWQRRTAGSWPEEDATPAYNAYARRGDQNGDEMYMRQRRPSQDELDEEEYDDERRMPWLKMLAAALAVVLLLCAGLHFIKDAGPLNPVKSAIDNLLSGPRKEPGEVTQFQTPNTSAAINTRLVFTVNTSKSVNGVRLEYENGGEIPCTAMVVNSANDSYKIWNVNAIFDTPYIGNVYVTIKDGDKWVRTDKCLSMMVVEPTPVPTEEPLATQVPLVTPTVSVAPPPAVFTPAPESAETESAAVMVTWEPTDAPEAQTAETVTEKPPFVPEIIEETGDESEDEAGDEPYEALAEEPSEAPSEEPTQEPVPTDTPGPTLNPTATPLPHLEASTPDGSLKTVDTVFVQGKKSSSFARENTITATHPDDYDHYHLGVFTFRGDNFRRNAAYGRADVKSGELTIQWQTSIGSLSTADSGTLYGVGWTGQPAIVRWSKEVKAMMNVFESAKEKSPLIEVIFGAQDGKIYFLDIKDGSATRETINVGFPLKGSVSVDSFDRPLLAVGQGISKLKNKTGSIGLHLYNLMDGKEAFFLNGRKTNSQAPYTSNGAFDGTPLFVFDNQYVDAMIVAGENGLLYTVDLGSKFIYPNVINPDAVPSMEVKPTVTYLKTKASDEKDTMVGVESSVAMYDRFIYMADAYGIVRCVDSDSMKTVWAFDGGDNVDCAMALDMVDTDLSLYFGNTNYGRLGTKKDVTIRRLNALTGEEVWSYPIKCAQDRKTQLSGCKASPVIGQHGISNLVIFTVNMVEGGGSRIIALDKQSGQAVWTKSLPDQAISSPIAVYNERGDAWIVQCDEGGNVTVLSGRTGQTCSTLNLGGPIQGSPAAYKDYILVGTCGKDNANMYCLKIH